MVASALLSGAIYPVDVLPESLQIVARALPQTHAIEAMRLAVLQGHSIPDLASSLVSLLVFVIILLPLSLAAFHYAARRSKMDGSLAHY